MLNNDYIVRIECIVIAAMHSVYTFDHGYQTHISVCQCLARSLAYFETRNITQYNNTIQKEKHP